VTNPRKTRRPGDPEADMHPTLTRRTFLLACSPERERLLSRAQLGPTLQAAALHELLRRGLVEDHDGTVRATATRAEAPQCDLETALLARITADTRARPWRYWIRQRERAAVWTMRDALVRERVIRVESRRVLGLFRRDRITLRRPELRTAATDALWDALKPTRPATRVDEADAALVVLAYEGELRVVLGGRERRAAKGRVRAFEERLGPVPGALRQVVRSRKRQQAAAGSG
jgi:hypothetical protein